MPIKTQGGGGPSLHIVNTGGRRQTIVKWAEELHSKTMRLAACLFIY